MIRVCTNYIRLLGISPKIKVVKVKQASTNPNQKDKRVYQTNVDLCYSHTMVSPPVRGDNPRVKARGLSPRMGGKNHGMTIIYHPYQCRPRSA